MFKQLHLPCLRLFQQASLVTKVGYSHSQANPSFLTISLILSQRLGVKSQLNRMAGNARHLLFLPSQPSSANKVS